MYKIAGMVNWVLVIMAAASCISMVAVLNLENIISKVFPSYELQFNYS